MALVPVFEDSFHLVPGILDAVHPAGDYRFWLGTGKLVTSITMTQEEIIRNCEQFLTLSKDFATKKTKLAFLDEYYYIL